MKIKRYLPPALAGIALLTLSNQALAECQWLAGKSAAAYTYSPPIGLVGSSLLSYIIHQDYISGPTLAAMTGAANVYTDIIQCTSEEDLITFEGGDFPTGELVANSQFKFIRPNNNVRVGFVFRSSKSEGYWVYPDRTTGAPTAQTLAQLYALNGTSFSERNGRLSWSEIIVKGGYNINIYAFKAGGSVNSGHLPAGLFGSIKVGLLTVLNINFSGVDVTAASCEIKDYPAEVPLGIAYKQRFPNPGDTQNETTFSISLACEDTRLLPALAFEGATDSTHKTVFSNTTGEGYAANVGVQLMRNGSVITPGALTPATLGSVTSTAAMAYDFSARLFRLNGNMTSGAVEVPVTFTITYE
ncbi:MULTISPECIES: fimbrial protein [Enterobacteriaceae]|uniref:Fimbrial protein n=1 Tax=Raoultella lignicola TaxID=3040939 RepID=A0ABU9FCZ1_9ENTR|nr:MULTISPECIES: fimbrial protein [Enterobacteriaceae]MRT48061.1 fimbrial protein [Raoultella sp. RIT712]QNK05874.1 fimbrial protein [Enterobacter sp. JUb54]ROS13386.1 type 1 fimbria pilin [Raoultella sp. BIGb0399]